METVLLVNKQDSYLPVLETFTKVFQAYFSRNHAKIKVRNIDFPKNIGFGQIHKENSFAGREISSMNIIYTPQSGMDILFINCSK